jgi:hypothetical protein
MILHRVDVIKISLLLPLILMAGCASSIMKGYVGKPVTTVIGDHGFPAGAYDVDTNKRAFVWQKNAAVIVPGSSYTSGSVIGNQIFSSTYSTPGYSGTFSCAYTLIATKTRSDIDGPAAWTVVDFVKPKFGCE